MSHVKDIALANLLALNYLNANGDNQVFNCGSSKGTSVQEIIEVMQGVAPQSFPVRYCDKRPNDLATIVSNNQKIQSILGWKAEHSEVYTICSSALHWEQSQGYSNNLKLRSIRI